MNRSERLPSASTIALMNRSERLPSASTIALMNRSERLPSASIIPFIAKTLRLLVASIILLIAKALRQPAGNIMLLIVKGLELTTENIMLLIVSILEMLVEIIMLPTKTKHAAASSAYKLKNAKAVLRRARKYYAQHREQCCSDRRRRYELLPPKPTVKQDYLREMTKTLLNGGKVLVQAFKKQHGEVAATMSKSTQKRAAASIAARRLLNKVLQVRQYQAGTLLKAVRSITNMDISEMSDFGNGSHCSHSEPYFYESAYQFSERPDTMSVDYSGVCRPFGESIDCEEGEHKSWKCSSKCKSLSGSEIDTIINFRSIFDKSMLEIRKCLDACDYCPNNRYTNPCGVQLMGHSLVCFTGNECKSSLRILRAASVHYAVLRFLLTKSVFSFE